MRKPPFRLPSDLVAATAILFTRELSVRAIANELTRILKRKVSPTKVHRMLKQAEGDHYLKCKPTIDFTRLPRVVHRAALELLVPSQIDDVVRRLAPPGHTCTVSVIQEDAAHDASVRAFGLVAAQVLVPYLLEAKVLGVAWGRLVNALVDGLIQVLPQAPCGPGSKYGLMQLIPVVGEPMHVATTMHEFSSTVLTTRFEEVFNRKKTKVPSLAGVPAYLPGNGGNVRKVLRKFFGKVPSYAGFVGKQGLFASVDTIVTGAGVPRSLTDGHHGVFVSERVMAEDIDYTVMTRLVCGDLAGVLIPRRGLNDADAATVAMLNEGWTGLRLADIKRCAQAANTHKRGGVIVLANDASKADLVREIVSQGLVNHLVIDITLAKALRRNR